MPRFFAWGISGLLLLTASSRSFAQTAVELASAQPSFLNDVLPLLTRLGCNQGACHGKGSGQNGFRLSLRGYAPEWDHLWLTREFGSRRINPAAPEASLLLRKPLGLAPHEGGKLMQPGSREHRLLLSWISAGMPGPHKDDPVLQKIAILPGSALVKAGDSRQLKVQAEFSNGESKDVTWLTQFDTNDAGVAEVSASGLVRMLRPGETAVRATFQGQVAVALFTAPYPDPAGTRVVVPHHNVIDSHIFAKLAALNLEPSELCSDEVFVRRAFLDTIGVLPTSAEARAFLADQHPSKRGKLIDQLLDRPEFVDFWTWWLADLLQNRKESDHDVRGAKGVRAFHEWIRTQVAVNRPWDEMARDILTVSGTTHDQPAVGYFIVTVGENRQAHQSPVVASVAQTFLGTRIGCAQCHNHPLEKYTQDDYYHFAGFFSRIKLERKDPRMGSTSLLVSGPNSKPNKDPAGVVQPRTGKFLAPRPLDRSDTALSPEGDPRAALAAWITQPKNEYFAAAMVNRLWKHFFGYGMVEPVDDLRASNPPSHPELWNVLAEGFVQSKFDRKQLMRLILNSRAYQLSSTTKPGNEKDKRFFSHYYVRRLPAEVLCDVIDQAVGVPERFDGYPVGLRAIQVPDPAVKSYFLELFGRSERITACACERNNEVTLPQMLHLLGGIPTGPKLRDPEGRLPRWLKSKWTDEQITEEVFLTCLGRLPRDSERQLMRQTLKQARAEGGNGEEVFRDLFWAVLNSNEFAFQH